MQRSPQLVRMKPNDRCTRCTISQSLCLVDPDRPNKKACVSCGTKTCDISPIRGNKHLDRLELLLQQYSIDETQRDLHDPTIRIVEQPSINTVVVDHPEWENTLVAAQLKRIATNISAVRAQAARARWATDKKKKITFDANNDTGGDGEMEG